MIVVHVSTYSRGDRDPNRSTISRSRVLDECVVNMHRTRRLDLSLLFGLHSALSTTRQASQRSQAGSRRSKIFRPRRLSLRQPARPCSSTSFVCRARVCVCVCAVRSFVRPFAVRSFVRSWSPLRFSELLCSFLVQFTVTGLASSTLPRPSPRRPSARLVKDTIWLGDDG